MNSERKVPVDIFDRELKVGDIAVYPLRSGSRMWVERITINEVGYDLRDQPYVKGVNSTGRKVTVKSIERMAIVGRDGVIPFYDKGN